MAHARFTLEGWDPMKPVKWVIRFVQAFLEQHGRVALKDPRNKRPAGGAATAYSRAEHALCRLQTLSGTRPRWAFENTELAAAACPAGETYAGHRLGAREAAHGRARGRRREATTSSGAPEHLECLCCNSIPTCQPVRCSRCNRHAHHSAHSPRRRAPSRATRHVVSAGATPRACIMLNPKRWSARVCVT